MRRRRGEGPPTGRKDGPVTSLGLDLRPSKESLARPTQPKNRDGEPPHTTVLCAFNTPHVRSSVCICRRLWILEPHSNIQDPASSTQHSRPWPSRVLPSHRSAHLIFALLSPNRHPLEFLLQVSLALLGLDHGRQVQLKILHFRPRVVT